MTDRNGSLKLPEFEDRLWGELEQLHAATNEPIHLDRSPRRTRVLAVAAAVVAATAFVGGAVVALSSDSNDGTADVATSPDEGDTGAADAEASGEEVEGPPDAIVHVEQVMSVDGYVSHDYYDETTGAYRFLQLDVAGNPELDTATFEIVENEDGTVTETGRSVDHSAGTFTENTSTVPVTDTWPRVSWRHDDQVRGWIADGSSVEDGLEEVDGQELLRVVDVDPLEGQANPELGVTWVDPETYRPVKRLGYPGSDAEYTMTYEYLERTEENLALLEPEVPEGFTETEPFVTEVDDTGIDPGEQLTATTVPDDPDPSGED